MYAAGTKASCVRGVRRGCTVALTPVSMCESRLRAEIRSDDLCMMRQAH